MPHKTSSFCANWAADAFEKLQQENGQGIEGIINAAWAITLWCYSGDGDFSFPSVRNRTQSRCTASISGMSNIASLVQSMGDRTVEEVSNEPAVQLGPNSKQNPLSNTVAVFASSEDAMNYVTVVLKSYLTGLACTITTGQIACTLHYSEQAIDSKTADRIAATFSHIIDLIIAGADTTLNSVDIVSENDMRELWSWNHAQAPDTVYNCAQTLFQNQVRKQPRAMAIDAFDGSFTYEELDRCSDRIAHYLVSMEIGPESMVALCFEKSRWAIVALMGVVKAGGASVFIDPSNPRSRREEILKQIPNTEFVLTDKHHEKSWRQMGIRPIVICDELVKGLREFGITPRTGVCPDNLLYIIFTSGSTGIPKACQITHSAFLSGALQHAAKSNLGPRSRVLQLVSYSFDVSVLEIITSLISGACVCTPGNDAMVRGLADVINQYQITWTFLTPSLVSLIKPDEVPTLKTLILGGELLHKSAIQTWAPRLQLVNGYGPSECSIAAAGDPRLDPDSDPANIGRAIGGLGWIVQADDHDRLVPIGAVGELLISGPILARGYLNNPEKTSEVFIKNPTWTKGAFGPAANFRRFYKTGDLARFNSDGTIQFIGRKDTQVKLRGLRIELGEIEHHIARNPCINHVAVHLPKQGPCSDKLVAVVSLKSFSKTSQPGNSKSAISLVNKAEAKAQLDAVKNHVTGNVPEYMIPSLFIAIEAWPLLTSAKLDRKRMQKWLQEMEVETYHGIIGLATPQNATGDQQAAQVKARLTDILSRILNIPADVIPDDKSFLGLGGDSITAMQVMSQCRSHGISLTVRDILRSKDLDELAVSAKSSSTVSDITSTEEKFDHPFQLSPVQRMYARKLRPDHEEMPEVHFNQSFWLRITKNTPRAVVRAGLDAIVSRHSMLRCRFHRDASGNWSQKTWARAEGAYRFKCHTLRSIEDAGVVATIAQRTLGLAGPVFSVDLLQLGQEQFLFMVAHHAVIDWVSWRILIRDLEVYIGTGAIGAVKPLPFQNWINMQAEHEAENGAPEKTLPFKVPPPNFAYWDIDASSNIIAETTEQTFRLNKETTASLLGDRPHKALRTETLDFLLSALFSSFGRIFSDRDLPTIFREGHGREPWDASLDVAGTVGWFTTMYPLAIEASPSEDVMSMLRKVKDVRHQVPDNGRPYFASRFHNERAAELFKDHDLIEISFDYLGQFQTLERPDATLRVEPRLDFMPQSDDMGKNLDRLSLIEITAEVIEGQMQYTFVYNKHMKFQDRILAWVETSKNTLDALILNTMKAQPSCTLSDFPLLPLSYDGLDKLVKNRLPRAGITNMAAVEDIYPCSSMQQGLLVSQSLSDTSVYEYCHVMEVRPGGSGATIDAERFAEAWAKVVQRHSSLRTVFLESAQSGLYDQVVVKATSSNTTIVRCSNEDVDSIFQQSTAVALNDRNPPHRLTICAVADDKLVCQLQINHAIVDGGSIANIFRDLSLAYRGNLPDDSGFRFGEYIGYIQRMDASTSLGFWTEHLRGVLPSIVPQLAPLEQPVGEDKLETFEMNMSLSPSSIQAFCERMSVTPVSLFQVAWAMVLKVYTESPDVCFGYLCSGRDAPLPGIEDGVGAFLTMLVCRLNLANDMSLGSALRTLADDFVKSLPHQHAGLDKIQHALGMSGSPLFNTLLSFHRNEHEKQQMDEDGILIQSLSVQDPTEYPLSLEIGFSKDKLTACMQHSIAHLSSGQARSIANTFDQALLNIVTNPDETVGGADLVGTYDIDKFTEFNATNMAFSDRLMFSSIEEHARSQPDAEAISSWDGTWTYKALDEESTRIAHHLRSLGVGPEIIVPHCFYKSAWAAITMLAISKAGGAFVGLDPAHPRDRLVDLMAEVKATIICVSPDTEPMFKDMENIQLVVIEPSFVDSLLLKAGSPCLELKPDNLACIILTSGTTGRPKTIAIEHRSMSTMSDLIGPRLDMNKSSRVFNFASFTYDISTHDIFVTWQRGGCVCMPSEEERVNDVAAAIRRLRANWVSMTNTVLSLLRPEQVPSLKFIITGGEPVAKETVETWVNAGGVKMVLGCGPAETTITMSVSAPINSNSHHRNIGRTYGGRTWIVDVNDHNKLLPLGAAGEVLIEGPQLARCYLGNPEKTAESFIFNPKWTQAMDINGETRRFYKSGDICRWNSDGSMSIVGRKDTQVKINGRRVELGEISYQVGSCLGNSQVKVVVDAMALPGLDTRGLTLVAFLQYPSDSPIQTMADSPLLMPASDEMVLGHVELQERLASRLPQYMVPSMYVPIASVPRTPNGKLDRRRMHKAIESLSKSQAARYSLVDTAKKAPQTDTEALLHNLWCSVLTMAPEAIGTNDSFFRLGGDSVCAIKLVAAAREQGMSLSVPLIFKSPRLSEMALAMSKVQESGENTDTVVEDRPFDLLPPGMSTSIEQIRAEVAEQCNIAASSIVDLYPCTPFQEALVGLSARLGGGAYMAQKVFRFTEKDFNKHQFRLAWRSVVASEPILRTRIVSTKDAGTLQAVTDQEIDWVETEQELESYLESDLKVPTTYGSPMIRLAFVNNIEARYFVWSAHHAVYDAWSAAMTVAHIRGALTGQDVPKSIPYKHFIRHLGQTSSESHDAFWDSQFPVTKATPMGYPPTPVDYKPTVHGVVKTILKTKVTGQGTVTAPTLFRAAWTVTLSQYSGSDDVIFAAALSGRTVPVTGIASMHGPTLATVPVRVDLLDMTGAGSTVQQYLDQLQTQTTEMMPYEQTGLYKIRRISESTRAAVDSIGSLLVIQANSSEDAVQDFNGMESVSLALDNFDSYPLVMICDTDSTGCVTVEARHDVSMISEQQTHLKTVLPSSDDVHEIMGWNGALPEASKRCIHHVVAARAKESPLAQAVCAWDGNFSYEELGQASDKLAAHLQGFGIHVESKVAICVEKSRWHVVAMMAVLKAGGAYTNLNPAYPASMLQHVIDELQATTIICSPQLADLLPSTPNMVILDNDFIERLPIPLSPVMSAISPRNSAMVVFTSGSTGKPKGVVIEHGQFSSMERYQSPQLGIQQSTRTLQFAAHWFDISNFDAFNTLMRGGCLCIPSESERLDNLSAAINKYGVNWATMVPTAAVALDPDEVPNLKHLSLGGEPIRPDLHARWSSRVHLINSYGPAECSVLAMLGKLTTDASPQNIGFGVGCRTWITDMHNHDRLLPVGCVGELCVEGPIVARGYLYRPDLTAQAFITDPGFASQLSLPMGTRIYKTGDLVRYGTDGSLIYVGRNDSQVKIHGRRIECGEVEHHMMRNSLPGHTVAVEKMYEGDSSEKPVLAAFICLQAADPTDTAKQVARVKPLDADTRRHVAHLREQLGISVPSYMVPSLFITLDKMPVTQTGKSDRKALRSLGAQLTPEELLQYRMADGAGDEGNDVFAPACSTPSELQLQLLWAQILDISADSIRSHDHFIQKGGDSVRAISIVTAVRQTLGKALTVTDIFRHPRLKDMATILDAQDNSNAMTGNAAASEEEGEEEVKEEEAAELAPFALLDGEEEERNNILDHASEQCNVSKEKIEDIYPCTPLQEGLMAISTYTPGAYVATRVFSIPEAINLGDFKAAWARAMEIFPILRTRIIPVLNNDLSSEPVTSSLQVVLKEQVIEWDEIRSSVKTYLAQNDSFRSRAIEYGQPLSAYALSQRSRRFVWSIHHALYDGVSTSRVLHVVQRLCRGDPVPASFPGFNRFLLHLSKTDATKSDQFWRQELGGGAPASFPRLPYSTYQAQPDSEFIFSFNLAHAKKRSGILKSTLMRSAWALLSARYMESDDIVFGETLSGRNSAVARVEDFVGPTITTVPVRVKLDGKLTVAQYLQRIQDGSISKTPFQHVGLQALRKLGPEVRASLQFNNLFEIFSQQQEDGDATDRSSGESLMEIKDSTLVTGFFNSYAIFVECILQRDDGVQIEVRYDKSVISAWQVERMCGHFEQITAQLCVPETRLLDDVDMAGPEDMALMNRWNEDGQWESVDSTVHDLFADQVRTQPHATAISGWDGEFTYEELDAASTIVAETLVSLWNVQSEDIVPLCFEKSKWTIVAALGVLKAGGAVTQLGISHPMARKLEVLQDTKARFIIASPEQASLFNGTLNDEQILIIGEQQVQKLGEHIQNFSTPLPQVMPNNTAYVLFTSGSTGRSKGIVVEHRNLCTSSRAHGTEFGINSGTRVMQLGAYTFDISCADIFTTLQRGGTVCIPSEDERVNDIAGAIEKYQANWMFTTPTVAQMLIPESVPSLRTLVLGGEAPNRDNVETWSEKVKLLLIWGPAETTIYASANPPATLECDPARLGRPLGCKLWLCHAEDYNRIAPLGCVGEIVVEGPTVSRGYLNDKAKTADAFIEDPHWALAQNKNNKNKSGIPRRMYKTGDLARYDEDGVLRYVGRKDNQVKLHGQRLELEEVEHHIMAHSTVRHAVTHIPRIGPLKDKLVAVLTFHGVSPLSSSSDDNTGEIMPLKSDTMAGIDMADIRQGLVDGLPSYMVPSVWIGVEAIPLNGNSKIDRKRMKEWFETMDHELYEKFMLGGASSDEDRDKEASTPQEAVVQGLVRRVLNNPSAGLTRSFLSLGGDSITAMQLRTQARTKGLELTVQDILKSKSLEILAAAAKPIGTSRFPSAAIVQQEQAEKGRHSFGLSPIQKLFFDSMTGHPSALHSFDQSFLFQINQKVDVAALRWALETIVSRHAMLRARFRKSPGGQWSQSIGCAGMSDSFGFSVKEVESSDQVERILMEEADGRFDIEQGPMFVGHLFEVSGSQEKQLLFLGAHHLVVDLVSWRIILNDLQELLFNGKLSATESPPSFQTWLQMQEQYASSLNIHEVLPYSAAVPATDLAYWGIKGQSNTYGAMIEKGFVLNELVTSKLFGSSNRALNTEPVDIMLAALMTAFRTVFSERPIPAIYSEGHGRESWDTSIDPNGTVGWFTTMSPVYLASLSNDLKENVRLTKDIRRSIPGNGMPHFSSRFLAPEGEERFGSSAPVELLFNYAGKYQQLETEDALFTAIDNQVCRPGSSVERFALFDISAAVRHEQARITINYNANMQHQDRILQWVATAETMLKQAAEVLDSNGPRISTISDFPQLQRHLDREKLAAIEELLLKSSIPMDNVLDMYPCTAMQHHMLAAQEQQHLGQGGRDGLFEVDISHYIKGKVDMERLKTAWQKVVDHHSILRTVFLPMPGDNHSYFQVLLSKYDAQRPVISCVDEEDLVARLRGFKSVNYSVNSGDKARPHQQFTLFTASSRVRTLVACKLEISHALNDGISTGILFRDLDIAYRGQQLKFVSKASEFGDYVLWSEKLKTQESVKYWRDIMDQGNSTSTTTPRLGRVSGYRKPTRKSLEICLDRALVAILPHFTRQQGVTLATFFQTVWGLVLQSTASPSSSLPVGKWSSSSSTAAKTTHPLSPFFGYMTANRDAFPGAEDMVGPLTNMLLCPTNLDASMRVADLLKKRQSQYLDALPQQFGLEQAVKETMHERGENWEGRLPRGLCSSVMSLQYTDTDDENIPTTNNETKDSRHTGNSITRRSVSDNHYQTTSTGPQLPNSGRKRSLASGRSVSTPLRVGKTRTSDVQSKHEKGEDNLELLPLEYEDPNDYDISVGVQIATTRRNANSQNHQQYLLGKNSHDTNTSVQIKAQFVYWTDAISDARAAFIKRSFERCAAELVGSHYGNSGSPLSSTALTSTHSSVPASSAGLRVWMLIRRVGMVSA
ncbi:hypothetical protein HBI83_010160 [Parastagonospora nodorum]|nr:hypothetical protein HBI83_010160 [Parastagonospora nodorum]